MNSIRVLLIFVFFSHLPVYILCQSIIISDELNMRNDFSYFIVPINGELSLVRDKSIKIIYQRLLQNRYWTQERELDLEGKKWNVLDVFRHSDQFGVLYTSRVDKTYKCFYTVFDLNGNKTYQRMLADSMSAVTADNINLQSSLKKEFVSVGYRDLWNTPIIFLYNRIQDSIYYTIETNEFLDSEHGPAEEALLTDEGVFYLKYDVRNSSERSRVKYLPKIIGISATGKKVMDEFIKLDFEIFSSKMTTNTSNGELLLAGMYKKPNNQEILGYFIQHVDKNTVPSLFSFEENKVKEWTGNRNKGALSSYELQLRSVKFEEDGSCLVFFESVKQYVRRPYFGAGMDNGGSFSASRWIDYYYDDIIVSNIGKDGQKMWETILRKKQFSQDDDGISSSFFILENKSFLRIIFNDEIKNESTVSEYILLPNGQSNRKSILNTSSKKLNLRIREAIQIDPQCILIPNEDNGKLNIVQLCLN